MSLGSSSPSITDFSPKSGTVGDTVLVKDQRFSSVNETNKVLFDTQEAIAVASTDSLITVIVPTGLGKNENPVAVSIAGNKAEAISA